MGELELSQRVVEDPDGIEPPYPALQTGTIAMMVRDPFMRRAGLTGLPVNARKTRIGIEPMGDGFAVHCRRPIPA